MEIGMVIRTLLLASAVLIACLCTAVEASSRVALVVGNSAYIYAPPLRNPVNDAKLMAKTLNSVGFEVLDGVDLDARELRQKIDQFTHALRGAQVGLFFFAGHGFQSDGRNYLVPVDATLEDAQHIQEETIAVDVLLQAMGTAGPDTINIVILDACRDNPLVEFLANSPGTRSVPLGARPRTGLAEVRAGINSLIAFATQPGNTATDGPGATNSPFTDSLARHILNDDRNINAILNEVRKDVVKATARAQVPWDHSSLLGEFFFWYYGVPASTETDSSRLNSFTWQSAPNEVNAGIRKWSRRADGQFVEAYPSGHTQVMQTRARILLDGCAGTVVGPADEPNFAIFLPDRGCKGMVARWQRGRGTHWNVLSAMENVR
jgi:hypothetical protein